MIFKLEFILNLSMGLAELAAAVLTFFFKPGLLFSTLPKAASGGFRERGECDTNTLYFLGIPPK